MIRTEDDRDWWTPVQKWAVEWQRLVVDDVETPCRSLSRSGNYIGFASAATTLVPREPPGNGDIFLWRRTGVERCSGPCRSGWVPEDTVWAQRWIAMGQMVEVATREAMAMMFGELPPVKLLWHLIGKRKYRWYMTPVRGGQLG